MFWPLCALHQNLSVCSHSWFCETDPALELQLDANDLFYAVVTKVGVFGSKRRFGVGARDERINRYVGIRVEVNPGGLADLDAADLSFGDEAAKVDFAQVKQG